MTTTAGGIQVLTFSLGDEVFAMDIRTVREIIQHGNITSVPLMPFMATVLLLDSVPSTVA